jgi:hypothetical protein
LKATTSGRNGANGNASPSHGRTDNQTVTDARSQMSELRIAASTAPVSSRHPSQPHASRIRMRQLR